MCERAANWYREISELGYRVDSAGRPQIAPGRVFGDVLPDVSADDSTIRDSDPGLLLRAILHTDEPAGYLCASAAFF